MASKTWLNGTRKSIFDAEKGAILHYLRRFLVSQNNTAKRNTLTIRAFNKMLYFVEITVS